MHNGREIHRRVTDAVEKLYSDHLGELVDRLVHHAVQGELREKAVYYLQQAAARFALHDPQAWFEQALAVC